MPTLFCCIVNCDVHDSTSSSNTVLPTSSTTSNSSNCSKRRKIFYRFPQNPERKQLWLSQISSADRIKCGSISTNSRICNAHFATGKPNLDSTHIDFMPTIFPWSSAEERNKSFLAVEEYELKIKELEQKILAKAFLTVSVDSKSEALSSVHTTSLPNPMKSINSNNGKIHNFNIDSQSRLTNNCQVSQISKQPALGNQSAVNSLNSTATISNAPSSGIDSGTNSNLGASSIALTSANLNTTNILQYILNSLVQANNSGGAENNATISAPRECDGPPKPLSINISMPTGPLNLSQSHNKAVPSTNTMMTTSTTKSVILNAMDPAKTGDYGQHRIILRANNDSSLDGHLNGSSIMNSAGSINLSIGGAVAAKRENGVITRSPRPVVEEAVTVAAGGGGRSCTCTKSSCLKLYCECFANGSLCCAGCSCINCRNNDGHLVERTRTVNSYLERDPTVFSSKIEVKDVGKKHSKGCNCLKSSCLKNYCECFENKVFCSNLCRCRMCFNTEEHTHHNNTGKEEPRLCAGGSSHNSESLSIKSENSPCDLKLLKRKRSILKVNDIYEDVTSNESEDDSQCKKSRHIDVETVSPDNCYGYLQETGNLDDVDNQADHTGNQHLIQLAATDSSGVAHDNRIVAVESSRPTLPQETDYTEEELALMLRLREQRSTNSSTVSVSAGGVSCSPSVVPLSTNPMASLPSLLCGQQQQPSSTTAADLLQLLVAHQLLAAPSTVAATAAPTAMSLPSSTAPTITPRPPLPAPISAKTKLSAEDYVRKHIEAAERAVRADNARKESLGGYKKPVPRQLQQQPPPTPPVKVKIEPHSSRSLQSRPVQHSSSNSTSSLDSNGPQKQQQLPQSQQQQHMTVNHTAVTKKPSSQLLLLRHLRSLRADIASVKLRMLTDRNRLRSLEASVRKMHKFVDL